MEDFPLGVTSAECEFYGDSLIRRIPGIRILQEKAKNRRNTFCISRFFNAAGREKARTDGVLRL